MAGRRPGLLRPLVQVLEALLSLMYGIYHPPPRDPTAAEVNYHYCQAQTRSEAAGRQCTRKMRGLCIHHRKKASKAELQVTTARALHLLQTATPTLQKPAQDTNQEEELP